ncbi:hypothetical protein J8Z28_07775 [Pseudoalteromonas sp. SCSIO 43088]|uniref:hypothetical protein n=1 Tax=Pseudoalteromonas sp. SCSIO 43088 TaxID=2822846 RepID=UPI00202ACB68|nr:hypothetical protein [Pseudoalteromonas sp. SCSIO 43088]URQ87730.1 hypothetical protein J8Z28_07775 [Pseudoalteromonas sp. SCSIO 43088]
MKETFYKGAQGNLSLHVMTLSLASLAAGSTVIAADQLPIGTQVTGVRVINGALGANTELTTKLVDAKGTETELSVVDAVAAGTDMTPVKPVYIGDTGPSDLVIENTGTGAATGEVIVQLEYRFKGY